jgi:hypothetical protein
VQFFKNNGLPLKQDTKNPVANQGSEIQKLKRDTSFKNVSLSVSLDFFLLAST